MPLLLVAWLWLGIPMQVAPSSLVGKPAPPITVDQWLGSPAATPAYRKGKVVMLDFWATWCAPCIAQFPIMKAWKKKHGADLVIVGMTNLEGQALDEIKAFLAKSPLDWAVAVDNGGATHAAFGVVPIPYTFLIDRRGVVRLAHGGKKFEELEPHVAKLLAEKN
jgi:thiol-disulfide isomerase/thioredoxin